MSGVCFVLYQGQASPVDEKVPLEEKDPLACVEAVGRSILETSAGLFAV